MVIEKVTNISLFFIKVVATNLLLKLNYLQSRAETQYRKIIFITYLSKVGDTASKTLF